MARLVLELPLKSILVAFSLSAIICVGCGDNSGPAGAVAEQNEIERYLAENPDANVDMEEEDDDQFSE